MGKISSVKLQMVEPLEHVDNRLRGPVKGGLLVSRGNHSEPRVVYKMA